MKKIYFTLSALLLLSTFTFAKTYTVGSGKWTDATTWNNQYPGNTIKADDVVVITGQMTVNTGIVVEGTLQVEKGASMVGMKDLVILKSGKFVNNGNTVMKNIINSGDIQNNMILESMVDFDNRGGISNNNSVVSGNNFNNFGGNANGKSSAYFINNNLLTSTASKFGTDVKVMVGNEIENSDKPVEKTSFGVNALLKNDNTVELSMINLKKADVSVFTIEKSNDGKNYIVLDMISNINNTGDVAAVYTDTHITKDFNYYRVKAINAAGQETTLPVATVKTACNNTAFTLATE